VLGPASRGTGSLKAAAAAGGRGESLAAPEPGSDSEPADSASQLPVPAASARQGPPHNRGLAGSTKWGT
jgi:hypothetical protein